MGCLSLIINNVNYDNIRAHGILNDAVGKLKSYQTLIKATDLFYSTPVSIENLDKHFVLFY